MFLEMDQAAGSRINLSCNLSMCGEDTIHSVMLPGGGQPIPKAVLLLDEQYSQWPMPDQCLYIKVVKLPSWLLLPQQLNCIMQECPQVPIIGVGLAPKERAEKETVITWVAHVAQQLRCKGKENQVFILTGLPRAAPDTMNRINYNRNLSAGVRQWNKDNPKLFIKYGPWLRPLVHQKMVHGEKIV